MHIPVFGNGDINSPQKAKAMRDKFGVDGIMIGRASIGYPWIFNEIKHFLQTGEQLSPPTISQRVEVVKQHIKHSVAWKNDVLGILEMRRHYTNYFKGMPHFKHHRLKLVTLNSLEEILQKLTDIEREYRDYEFVTAV